VTWWQKPSIERYACSRPQPAIPTAASAVSDATPSSTCCARSSARRRRDIEKWVLVASRPVRRGLIGGVPAKLSARRGKEHVAPDSEDRNFFVALDAGSTTGDGPGFRFTVSTGKRSPRARSEIGFHSNQRARGILYNAIPEARCRRPTEYGDDSEFSPTEDSICIQFEGTGSPTRLSKLIREIFQYVDLDARAYETMLNEVIWETRTCSCVAKR